MGSCFIRPLLQHTSPWFNGCSIGLRLWTHWSPSLFSWCDYHLFPNMKKYCSDDNVISAVDDFFGQQDELFSLNNQMSIYLEINNAVINRKRWNSRFHTTSITFQLTLLEPSWMFCSKIIDHFKIHQLKINVRELL